MATLKNQINLLPEEELQKTTSGKIILWVLTTFRTIVIVTELVVMSAFLSRFWLDAQNADLTEKIELQKNIILDFAKLESDFRNTQKKLDYFKDLSDEGKTADGSLKASVTSLPEDVFLSSLSFGKSSIEISGASPSEKSIQQFIVNLNSKDFFDNVGLVEMRTDQFNPDLLNFRIMGKSAQKE
jgi:Tfp pilus assembly protein PilN